MDAEQREALELSKDDLLAKQRAGRPADVARTEPGGNVVEDNWVEGGPGPGIQIGPLSYSPSSTPLPIALGYFQQLKSWWRSRPRHRQRGPDRGRGESQRRDLGNCGDRAPGRATCNFDSEVDGAVALEPLERLAVFP